MPQSPAPESIMTRPNLDLPRQPDANWARFRPNIMQPPPNWNPNAESQFVTVRNTASNQRHVVIDRHYVGHELAPGQSKEIDMLTTEITRFMSLSRPRTDPYGRPLPSHPIVIDELTVEQVLGPVAARRQATDAERAQQALHDHGPIDPRELRAPVREPDEQDEQDAEGEGGHATRVPDADADDPPRARIRRPARSNTEGEERRRPRRG